MKIEPGKWVKITGRVHMKETHWATYSKPEKKFNPLNKYEYNEQEVVVIGKMIRAAQIYKTVIVSPSSVRLLSKKMSALEFKSDEVLYVRWEKIEEISEREALIYGL